MSDKLQILLVFSKSKMPNSIEIRQKQDIGLLSIVKTETFLGSAEL